MKPYVMNFVTGLVLVSLGTWGWLDSGSNTALIPVVFGLIFFLAGPMFKAGNKVVVHVVVLLTLLVLGALVKPFMSAMGREDTLAMVRVGGMLLTCLIAMIVYVKSFIDARKAA